MSKHSTYENAGLCVCKWIWDAFVHGQEQDLGGGKRSIHWCILGTQPCPLSQMPGDCFYFLSSHTEGRGGRKSGRQREGKDEKGKRKMGSWAGGRKSGSRVHLLIAVRSLSCPGVKALTLIKSFCCGADRCRVSRWRRGEQKGEWLGRRRQTHHLCVCVCDWFI